MKAPKQLSSGITPNGWSPPKWSPPKISVPTSGWRPPWTWSGCAKCELEVQAAIAGLTYLGGGPSGLAAAKLALAAKYGQAAVMAAQAAGVSVFGSQYAKALCKALGKCG